MTTINPEFLKVIVQQECQVYKNSENYKNLGENLSPSEKATIKILSVYDEIQKKLLDLEIERLKKNNSFKKK